VTSKKADALSNFHERLFSPPASHIVGDIISPKGWMSKRINISPRRFANQTDRITAEKKPYLDYLSHQTQILPGIAEGAHTERK
jgi:hypothetical protein